MPAKIRHIAIVSDQYALEGRFYEAVFGMKTAPDARPERAVTVSDGYVGLNINPRKAGRPAGLDHFGMEVEDLERVCARLSERDPAGNIFDLSQQGMGNRTSVYVEAPQKRERTLSHFALRTLNAEQAARFYVDVFELEPLH